VRDSVWPERDSELPLDADEVVADDEPDVAVDMLDELDDFELLDELLPAWAMVARLAAMMRTIRDFCMVGLRWMVAGEAPIKWDAFPYIKPIRSCPHDLDGPQAILYQGLRLGRA
jgi:hypothetical protein